MVGVGNVRKCPEMAQNGTFLCTGDNVLDETGAEALLLAIAAQAGKDLRRRNTPACYRQSALEFLHTIGLSDREITEVLTMAQAKVDEAGTQTDSLLRDFEELNERADRLLQATQPDAPRRQAAPPAPVTSPFEGMDAARLDALGVSPAWANMTGAQLAELERKQAHRDRAAALGVDWRYLPEAEE